MKDRSQQMVTLAVISAACIGLSLLAAEVCAGKTEGKGACAAACCAKSSSSSFNWFQFRGPNRNGKSAETGLLKKWPEGGP
ncbi:MAG: hypothetical protein ACYTEL_23825, partial [Planctomycetota bacterium]